MKGKLGGFGAREQLGTADSEDSAKGSNPEVPPSIFEDRGEAVLRDSVGIAELAPLPAIPVEETTAERCDPDFVLRSGENSGDPAVPEIRRFSQRMEAAGRSGKNPPVASSGVN